MRIPRDIMDKIFGNEEENTREESFFEDLKKLDKDLPFNPDELPPTGYKLRPHMDGKMLRRLGINHVQYMAQQSSASAEELVVLLMSYHMMAEGIEAATP